MSCMCAPTKHSGSFRCHLHRSQSWNGRTTSYRSGEDLELSTASLIENSLNGNNVRKPKLIRKPVASSSHPPLARSPSARSPPKGASRLRNVVSSSDEEDEVITLRPASPIGERIPNVKMATGTGGSYSSAPGGRAAMFRMLKTGQSTSKIFS
ncbi:hypothetical protein KC19_2G163100 [Ceratodon purpureus]|uniref:Uncharacterized protein n=1 Tax=Ceratodon purpureus TaxID=3225 RepID=A0A8T0IUK9_CERPU|nr:hypothetical protein KC19_2G163100 [Ceratodon purpureus]